MVVDQARVVMFWFVLFCCVAFGLVCLVWIGVFVWCCCFVLSVLCCSVCFGLFDLFMSLCVMCWYVVFRFACLFCVVWIVVVQLFSL